MKNLHFASCRDATSYQVTIMNHYQPHEPFALDPSALQEFLIAGTTVHSKTQHFPLLLGGPKTGLVGPQPGQPVAGRHVFKGATTLVATWVTPSTRLVW